MKIEVTTTIDRNYLMNKSKSELAYMILELLDKQEELETWIQNPTQSERIEGGKALLKTVLEHMDTIKVEDNLLTGKVKITRQLLNEYGLLMHWRIRNISNKL